MQQNDNKWEASKQDANIENFNSKKAIEKMARNSI